MQASTLRQVFRAGMCCAALASFGLAAQAAHPPVDANGTLTLPSMPVPFSAYASPEALRQFQIMIQQGLHAPGIGKLEASRAYYDKINSDRAALMQKLYPVKIHADKIAGVAVDVVEPAQGIAARQQHRVLINLHGGAFLWGAHSGGLVEAIPLASLGRIKVITVDYRQGPEHVFPAASDDVEAVYRAVMKNYPAKNIGIYGCSAGGALTAEATARIITDHLPVPGAIGTFCGSVSPIAGDSAYVSGVLSGDPPGDPVKLTDLPYFKGASASDPLVIPAQSPALLARFPPTLLITGTRDFTMSSVIHSQALLTAAGVDAELHVWDGMWHSFFSDPQMPESRQAYAVMVAFFDKQLGH
jgi:epsilon-lactone hydrolase